ncbi:gfo/Idh/MocA family oxidoreductase [Caulobacter sp. CCUG 60055]|uniref:Gfo/Idh/MocA family protein n=1 Tax=Caulobacter sp. CCUG 60055 TaxID=2100090 RepID=UPI001FA79EBA|nr:Gfo/Idh/MocA family oxidoreductase [Caulobacter sp. CCUG 60055]MBQ1540918.1 Gfo/Idh/MocA family oxidoreductase [Caulobacteraceae bacterium]MCI3179174.1 gfo/Idh/MocA family oxidoreductase [Caulobacter sp. CCUG 60055]
MSDVLKAGVVGAGIFGGYHANKYAALPGVTLTAVFDPHVERSEALGGPLDAETFTDLDAFLAAVDVVTVASPAHTHAEVALAALRAGRHVYVEKPLATAMDKADALVTAAAASGVVLACGHQERIVFKAMGLFDAPERPLRLEAARRGPWSPRATDVTCVLDLMIHDIDLALQLAGGEPLTVEAEGRITHGPFADEVRAEVLFADGMTAVFDTSRIADERRRAMRLVYPSGEVEVDFLSRTFRNTTGFALDADFAKSATGKDPLGASVAAFLAAVRGEAARPAVTGEEAARALDLALAVEHATGL